MPRRIKVTSKQSKKVSYLQYAGHPLENTITPDIAKAPWWHDEDVKDLAGWLARNNPTFVVEIDSEKAGDDVEIRRWKKPRVADLEFGVSSDLEF